MIKRMNTKEEIVYRGNMAGKRMVIRVPRKKKAENVKLWRE